MQLLDEQQTADLLHVSTHLLKKWRWQKAGPAWARIGRTVRYRPEDVKAFVEASLVRTRLSANNEEGEQSNDDQTK